MSPSCSVTHIALGATLVVNEGEREVKTSCWDVLDSIELVEEVGLVEGEIMKAETLGGASQMVLIPTTCATALIKIQ